MHRSTDDETVVLLDQQQSMVKELQKEIEALRAENRALKQALLSKSNGDVSVLRFCPLDPASQSHGPAQGGNVYECSRA